MPAGLSNITTAGGISQSSATEILSTICYVLNVVEILANIWIIASMIVYGKRNKKFRPHEGRRIYIVCLTVIGLSLPRYVIDQIHLLAAAKYPSVLDNCEVIMDITFTAGGTATMSSYFFLWLRQRAIYGNTQVKEFYGKRIKALSWFSLGFTQMLGGILLYFYIVPSTYTRGERGCVTKPIHNITGSPAQWERIKWYALAGYLNVCQLMLLFLFIYPIVKIKRARSTPKSNYRGKDNISAMLRRTTICAVVASVSDLTMTMLMNAAPRYYPEVIEHSAYDFSIMINDICILATFDGYIGIFKALCGHPGAAENALAYSGPTRQQTESDQNLSLRNI